MAYDLVNTTWIADDGSYGTGQVLLFDSNQLDEERWHIVGNLSDNDRLDYVCAFLNGEDTSSWED